MLKNAVNYVKAPISARQRVMDQAIKSFPCQNWQLLMAYCSFASVIFGIKLWLIGSYGNATPYWDQWDAEAANLYGPFLDGTLGWADLFASHNEHRIFTTRLLALALLNINGIWNPLLQMVVNAGLHIAALVFSISLLTRVIGRNYLPALLVFSLVLFGIPYGWENTLAGFQAQFYFVLLFSIACLWLTTTQQPLSARWWGGVVCGVFAYFSFASGIFPFASAAIVGLMFYALGRRKTHKQLLAVAILAGLFMLGAMLTPSLAYHAYLKAASFPKFFYALMAVLSWPISTNFFSALICNLPAFVFVGLMLYRRPPADDRTWFLLALVVWALGQTVSISYSRAVGNLSSRYLDLFAIGLLVNFVCLLLIVQDHIGKRHGWKIVPVVAWTITVIISLGLYAGKHIPPDLSSKRETGLAQEINTKNYLATGDVGNLKDKPYLHVPYPDSERLASILTSSSIRTILPTNIRSPLSPTLFESRPVKAFLPEGYNPKTPKRPFAMTWGSYGAQGNVTTGEASILFETNRQRALLAIPVAGYPLKNGIKLEVEQNGQRNHLTIKSNPGEAWGIAYAGVDNGAFSIHLTDASTAFWVAIGAPTLSGRLDRLINGLLANYLVFIMLGLAAGVLLLTLSGLTRHVTLKKHG